MTNEVVKDWIRDCSLLIESGVATSYIEVCPIRLKGFLEELQQLRGNLSLAEEGLANATQEIEALKHDNERLMKSLNAELNGPASLVGALQDVVHTDPGPVRAGRSVRHEPRLDHKDDCYGCRYDLPDHECAHEPGAPLAHNSEVRQEIKGKGDVPDGQFAGILKAAESGDPVNTMDLINALWWKIGNQRKELCRRNDDLTMLARAGCKVRTNRQGSREVTIEPGVSLSAPQARPCECTTYCLHSGYPNAPLRPGVFCREKESKAETLERLARDRFNEVHRVDPKDLWELQPEAVKVDYRNWVANRIPDGKKSGR